MRSPKMRDVDRAARRQRMVELSLAGKNSRQIASELHVTHGYVRVALARRGLGKGSADEPHSGSMSSVWDLPEDERRMAFAQRAAQAARAARETRPSHGESADSETRQRIQRLFPIAIEEATIG